MAFCPEWIFDSVSSQVANEFLSLELPLTIVAKKYSEGLAEKYSKIPAELFEETAESMIRAMDEVKVESEAVSILTSYTFFRIYYETNNVKRKMKPLFGLVDAPVSKIEYSVENATKRFKAYLFSIRSSVVVTADAGWKLSKCDELPLLRDISAKPMNVLDIL